MKIDAFLCFKQKEIHSKKRKSDNLSMIINLFSGNTSFQFKRKRNQNLDYGQFIIKYLKINFHIINRI
jgi:hypothetical protein